MTPCCVPIENGKWHVVRGAWCVKHKGASSTNGSGGVKLLNC